MIKRLLSVMILLFFAALFYVAVVEAQDRLSEALVSAPVKFEGIPILMYHKINPSPGAGGYGLRVHPRDFEKQMAYLSRKGYNTISLTDIADHFEKGTALPDRPVVITIDDGYLDNYTYAYPVLKKYGMTATIFVVAGTVGGINEFDYRNGSQPLNIMADWPQLRELADGGITIGAHTVRHPHLADINAGEARLEIVGSKRLLEEGLNRPVDVFCYPYGSYNSEVAAIVGESGFRAAVTTEQGLAKFGEGPFTLKRIRVRGDYSLGRFIEELTKYHTSRNGDTPAEA